MTIVIPEIYHDLPGTSSSFGCRGGMSGHSVSVQSGGPDWSGPYWPVWPPMNIA